MPPNNVRLSDLLTDGTEDLTQRRGDAEREQREQMVMLLSFFFSCVSAPLREANLF
jgi:hypothetical protein